MASFVAILAIGNPVALEASALERDTRGFISMTIIWPFCGLTANWMFEPPVSTPISRMTASAASRMTWYSLSVNVIAGATVIESPVCTPMGSKFSIEQMMTALSFLSRTTSSSYSFQPSTDCSTSTSPRGLCCRPQDIFASNSSAFHTMAAPEPPSVKEGRSSTGKAVGVAGPGHGEADLLHGLLEQEAVFRLLDGSHLGPDQLYAVRIQDPRLVQLEREVERRLPAQRRQERVGPLSLDDHR